MSKRRRIKGVCKARGVGHKPKHNKKSVAYRKKLKNELKRKRKEIRDLRCREAEGDIQIQ